MTRPLMHPLKQGGSLTRGKPGQWEAVQRPEQVTEIQLVEDAQRSARPGISSIPSPWARLQLFRDAILDQNHPARDDVLNDVLDALEVVLFQRWLFGVQLDARDIDLQTLERDAGRERKLGVRRFIEALQELAPDVGNSGTLSKITLVFNNDRLLFATSPFTLIFTPEVIRDSLLGYFVRNRPLRALHERPPLLAEYINGYLFPQLAHADIGAQPELQRLKTILEDQVQQVELPGNTGATYDEAGLYPATGIVLHRAAGGRLDSALALRPTRTLASEPAILVLDNSGSPGQQRYFPWLERPADALIRGDMPRNVLPGTSWKCDWISPEHDFLAEKLLVLDSPVYIDRVHGFSANATDAAARALLPLTPKFFEYFRAEDVSNMLTVRSDGTDSDARFVVRLTVPTKTDPVIVERTYRDPARIAASLSMWPGFVTAEEPHWNEYYVICFVEGEDVGEVLELTIGADGSAVPSRQFQRDISTVVHHFDQPPEIIYVRDRRRPVGDSNVAQGVILPNLRPAPRATKRPWTVAIDFGTSNTVVAYSDGQQSHTLGVTQATRFDLTRIAPEASHVDDILETFFFPPSLNGSPFGTVVFRSVGADLTSAAAKIPAVTANVPFSGDVTSGAAVAPGSRHANEIVGDLKWGGGGSDSERLTTLFLHQVLQLVHAEARARGVSTDGTTIRWSYPSAFSPRKQSTAATRWKSMLDEFRAARLHSTAPEPGIPASSSRDESTAAMLYLRTDPAAQGNFGPNSPYLKITADVGGGTTDVAAYANGGIVVRNSILFGGRNLISEPAAGVAQPGVFSRIRQWASSQPLPKQIERVLDAYPSQHTKFTYLVRHDWFNRHRGALSSEPWFPHVQACILYFYAAVNYNIGVGLRRPASPDVRPPNYLFFGGNGSSYLHWLTEFQPWNSSTSRAAFSTLFQRMLEAGLTKPIGASLTVLTSSKPKQEVALGLLEADLASSTLGVVADSPLGEDLLLGSDEGTRYMSESTLASAALNEQGIAAIRFTRPFAEREIARFNAIFQEELASLATTVDPQWRSIARSVQEVLNGLGESFYEDQVKNALVEHLRNDDVGAVTLFVIEATATLRQLEQHLFR